MLASTQCTVDTVTIEGEGVFQSGLICHQIWTLKFFFIKIIKFDFSLLQIMYILTQAWEIIVKHCGSFGTCAQSPKSSFISTVNWTKKVILRPRSPKIFLYENHQIQLFLTSNYPYFDPGFRNNCQTLWFSRYMPKRFKKQLEKAI